MKNKVLLILLIITFQSSFAQNEIVDKIKGVNQNMTNGLEVSDTVFKNILASLDTINNIVLNKINDSLDLEPEIIYYINRVTVSDYNIGAPKYFGFVTEVKTNKKWGFKYVKDNWKSDYELSIYEMSHDHENRYYSFLMKNSNENADKIFCEIEKYRAELSKISFGAVSNYEFLYMLNFKKKVYKGYSFILSHLIFLYEEAEKLDKFDQ